jgi:hypothetical protein
VRIISGFTNSVVAQEQSFIATLAGQEEVPPTDSQTSGTAEFTIMGDNAGYRVIASDIQDVTVHIHTDQIPNGEIRGQITSSQQ